MEYAVITQVSAAVVSPEKLRSSAGKATLTMERSSDPMKAPSEVTRKISVRTRFALKPASITGVSSVTKRTLAWCIV
jgi:hypothetical protein